MVLGGAPGLPAPRPHNPCLFSQEVCVATELIMSQPRASAALTQPLRGVCSHILPRLTQCDLFHPRNVAHFPEFCQELFKDFDLQGAPFTGSAGVAEETQLSSDLRTGTSPS